MPQSCLLIILYFIISYSLHVCFHLVTPTCNWLSWDLQENVESAVTVFADYVIYENMSYGESQITFFSDCIKFECYDARASDEKVVLKWEITDVIHITCQWSRSVSPKQYIMWSLQYIYVIIILAWLHYVRLMLFLSSFSSVQQCLTLRKCMLHLVNISHK